MFTELSARDIHECHQIAGRCRDLGADVDAWRQQLLGELRTIVDAQVIISSEIEHFGNTNTHDTRYLGTHRDGWISHDAEVRWREYAQSIPVERTPEYPYLSKFSGETLLLSRDQIWGRESWYRSHTFNEIHRECGIDDYIISICPTGIPDRCTTLWLHKGVGSRDFTSRERALVAMLHMIINKEIGSFLAAAEEPRISQLTKRRREVLERLLMGDSEKQIAFRFNVARATIHDHVLAIYRHFEVSSRGELLALFIGRAKPNL